jgi:hypothetical protein
VASSWWSFQFPAPTPFLRRREITDTVVELQPVRQPTDPPTFTRAADASIDRVRQTYVARGNAYGDSWALPNIHSPLTEYVLGLRRDPDYRAWLRLLRAAVLADVKESRMQGTGSIDDHLIDGVAYRLVFTELLRDYEGR